MNGVFSLNNLHNWWQWILNYFCLCMVLCYCKI